MEQPHWLFQQHDHLPRRGPSLPQWPPWDWRHKGPCVRPQTGWPAETNPRTLQQPYEWLHN
eukprot:6016673-Prorocentrum_lima.AAC.1